MKHLELALAMLEVASYNLAYGHLILGILRERHTQRIAYAIGKQRAYAHSTLYATLDAVTRLGDA